MTAGVAALVFGAGAARAQNAGYLRIVTQQGALDGASKDPAHMNWIPVASVVAADLDGDATADRESSAPSVSEIQSPRDLATGQASGRKSGSVIAADYGAAAVRESPSKASTGQTSVRESPTKSSTGRTMVRESPTLASTGQTTVRRENMSGMATGKRMHKPFVITKELDKSSPMLAKLMSSGTPIPEVDVELAQGRSGAGMKRYVLKEVMVSSIQRAGGGDRPMESVSFNYQKIEMK
jgi:type VI secretion system Hcp family effector